MPATSAALAGRVALASVEVMPAVSVIVLTRFQLASTALTVTLKALPAVWAEGVPVLPVALPGAAVSPGSKSWSLVNVPATTVIEPLAAESDSASPLVRCATSVSDSAFVYCSVLSVFELVPAVIVASTGARYFLRQLLEPSFKNVFVLSHSEIPPGTKVSSLGLI